MGLDNQLQRHAVEQEARDCRSLQASTADDSVEVGERLAHRNRQERSHPLVVAANRYSLPSERQSFHVARWLDGHE